MCLSVSICLVPSLVFSSLFSRVFVALRAFCETAFNAEGAGEPNFPCTCLRLSGRCGTFYGVSGSRNSDSQVCQPPPSFFSPLCSFIFFVLSFVTPFCGPPCLSSCLFICPAPGGAQTKARHPFRYMCRSRRHQCRHDAGTAALLPSLCTGHRLPNTRMRSIRNSRRTPSRTAQNERERAAVMSRT